MNPLVQTFTALEEVPSATLNEMQTLSLDSGQWLGLLGTALNGAWLGPRPIFGTVDGSNTQLYVGATPPIVLGGFVFPANTSLTTVTPSGLANGNWYYCYAEAITTTVASGSNNAVLPQTALYAANVGAFPASGTLLVQTQTGQQTVTYTSIDAGTKRFLGCSGGTGTVVTGSAIAQASLSFVTNSNAPDATNTWQNGGTTLRYIGSFRADHSGFLLGFRMVNGRYVYHQGLNTLPGFTVLNVTSADTSTHAINNIPPSGDSTPLIPPTSRHGFYLAAIANSSGSTLQWAIDMTAAGLSGANVLTITCGANLPLCEFSFEMTTDSSQAFAYKSVSDSGSHLTLAIGVLGYQEN